MAAHPERTRGHLKQIIGFMSLFRFLFLGRLFAFDDFLRRRAFLEQFLGGDYGTVAIFEDLCGNCGVMIWPRAVHTESTKHG